MRKENFTAITYFVLQGISDVPQIQTFLFVTFFSIYILILLGNATILITIHIDRALSSAPMFMFLSQLSFLDMCYTTVIFPKMLLTLLGNGSISYTGCFLQLFFFISYGQSESFLLAVMAYDRYVAICYPLYYVEVVTKRVYAYLTIISWFSGFLNSALHTGLATRLTFCSSNQISHFFCDITPLLKLSCVSTLLNEIVIYVSGVFVVFTPFLCILVSYIHIIQAILQIPSATGRHKTFSTCSSHLTVVCMFYCTVLLMYMRPSSYSQNNDKIFALLYTFVTPLLNPFIYGVRSREVKQILKRTFKKNYWS